jgi:hypothetical protein
MCHTLRTMICPALGTGLAIMLTAGCGGEDSLPRERLSGTVTLDGRPVEKGTIQFMPLDQANAATSTAAIITAGAYEVPTGQGLLPGPYQVTISSVEEAKGPTAKPKVRRGPGYDPVGGTGVEGAPPEAPTRQLIPARYNANTTLKADVAKGGKNVFDFPLTTK